MPWLNPGGWLRASPFLPLSLPHTAGTHISFMGIVRASGIEREDTGFCDESLAAYGRYILLGEECGYK